MTREQLIERIARAMFETRSAEPWDEQTAYWREPFLLMAAAALRVVEEAGSTPSA